MLLFSVHDATFGGGKALFDARLGDMVDMLSIDIPDMKYGWD
jgi:hypothetical protein